MSWERLAVTTGGTVAGLATAEADGCLLVFAATSGGIFRSADAGRTWTLARDGAGIPFAEVVVPSPNFARDRTLFVCAGDTLYRSSDAGQTWQPTLVGSHVLSTACAPGGVVLASTETDGVLRSEDAGRTWTGANAGLLDLTALAVALSPSFAHDHTGFVGTSTGLYRTRNRAQSWRALETGLGEPAVQCLVVSPTFADDRLVLAGTEADGLLLSEDAGTTWRQVVQDGVSALAFSPGKTIAAATEQGVAVSNDAGRTWAVRGPAPGTVLSLVYVDEILLAGLDRRGIAQSRDHGATWEPCNAGLTANVGTALVVTPNDTVFVADLQRGVSASFDGGLTWTERNAGLDDAAVFGLAASPTFAQDRTLYAATASGIHVSRDAGSTWLRVPAAAEPARAVVAAAGIVVAALSGGRLVASDDDTTSWHPLPVKFDGEVVSLALSPGLATDRAIFAATKSRASTELMLWRSIDGGEHWHRWLIEHGQDLLPLAVSPSYHIDQLVFAGLGGRVLKPLRSAQEVRSGERRPIWGAADLKPGAAVTALAVSPTFAEDRTVLAAANLGVFVSRDAANTFTPWSEGLGPSGVVALAISPQRRVYALSVNRALSRRRL
jgi:photosystem II stability/assembly factor-like uncharacterized protein